MSIVGFFMCQVNVVCLVCFEGDYKDFDVRRENSHVLCRGTCLQSFFPLCSELNFVSILIDTLHSSCANNSECKSKEQLPWSIFLFVFSHYFFNKECIHNCD